MTRLIKPGDLVVAAIVLLVAGAGFLMKMNQEPGAWVTVWCDGTQIGRYTLHTNGIYPLITVYGYNELVITDGAASIRDADCPDRLCVRAGHLRNQGGQLVCLPHHLLVLVTGGDSPEWDDMSY